MSSIYQQIWTADQEANGVEPILSTETGSTAQGFVKVNADLEASTDRDLKVITEVHIPDHKMATYNACLKLFNNYTLAERELEVDEPEERQEVHDFLELIVDTPPMEVARSFIASETGTQISRERWHNTLVEMWFRRFASGGDPHLSGFEHVVVGEQEGSKVQGYHFWWKYFLDDGFGPMVDADARVPAALGDDRITYHGSKQADGQIKFPESVTISYRWQAPDYQARAIRPLFKKIGGFFVGCSVEGLMALGTVRAHKGVPALDTATIEGARYQLKLFHSPSGQNIRTFYPIFKGPADPSEGGSNRGSGGGRDAGVRIIGAKINPVGHDPGFETISLVNTSAAAVSLVGWGLVDKNGSTTSLSGDIGPGEFKTIELSGEGVQLSNKGGSIRLVNASNASVHEVIYSKAQARQQGITVLF